MLGLSSTDIFGEDDHECDNDRLYALYKSQHCEYIMSADCNYESLIDYYKFFYCALGEQYIVFGIITVFPTMNLVRAHGLCVLYIEYCYSELPCSCYGSLCKDIQTF